MHLYTTSLLTSGLTPQGVAVSGPLAYTPSSPTGAGQWFGAAPSDRSYPGAGRGTIEDMARTYGAGFSRGGSADSHLTAARLAVIRRDSQFYYRNNVIARTLVEAWVQGVMGPTGPRLTAAASSDPAKNRATEDAFHAWTDRLDYRGLLSGPELMHVILRAAFVDGDVLPYLVRDEQGGGDLKMQVIEAERIGGADLSTKPGEPHGVITDAAGRIIGFRVADYDRSSGRVVKTTRTISPLDSLYFANLQRASQTRGEPGLYRLLPYLDQIDRAISSTVLAYQQATMLGLVTYTASPAGMQKSLPGRTAAAADGSTQKTAERPGGPYEMHLERGDSVLQIKPEHPTQNLPEFLRFMIRLMGMEIGLPLELVLRDYSEGNFFSARAARQDAEAAFRVWRERFARRVMTPLLRAWVELSDAERGIALTAREQTDLGRYGRDGHLWRWPAMPVFDEVAEATGARILLETNQASAYDIAERRGMDAEELLARVAEARKIEMAIPPAPWQQKSANPSLAIANAAAADANGAAARS
jgi:capsid protein